MAKQTWPRAKDPDEVRDYGVDWTADLNGQTITSSEWDVVSPATVTIDTSSHTNTNTTVRIEGGAIGEKAALVNTVTLANGEIAQQTCVVVIKER